MSHTNNHFDESTERRNKADADLATGQHKYAALELCEICKTSNKAISYCLSCEARFCSSCDINHHVGEIARHKRLPYTFKTRKTREAEDNRLIADSDTGLASDQDDIIKRHKRLLHEQIFLLKHKLNTGVTLLRPKLTKGLDTQMRSLVNGPLKEDFDELHKYLEDRELKIATDVFNWKTVFHPQIMEAIQLLETDVAKDMELIKEAEFSLNQGNAFLLESTSVQKLLKQMQDSVKRDLYTRIRMLEEHINLSEHRVHRMQGVKRAINRLYVSKDDTRGSAAGGTFVASQKEKLSLDRAQLQFVAASRLSWKKVREAWKTRFRDREGINTEEELKALIKSLCTQLVDDHPVADEYVAHLFSKYDNVSNLQTLKDEVLDAIHPVFEDFSSHHSSVYKNLRARMDFDQKRSVNRDQVSIAWALWVEKGMEEAVYELVRAQVPKGGFGLHLDDASESKIEI